jgi:hypothetical protein
MSSQVGTSPAARTWHQSCCTIPLRAEPAFALSKPAAVAKDEGTGTMEVLLVLGISAAILGTSAWSILAPGK